MASTTVEVTNQSERKQAATLSVRPATNCKVHRGWSARRLQQLLQNGPLIYLPAKVCPIASITCLCHIFVR